MDKKVISLQQLEEALRDMSRWIRDKMAGYIKEPEAEGQSGNVLMTNGAGGRSWGEVRSDDLWRPTVSEDGVLSWERSVNPNEPAAANIAGPAGVDGGYYTLRLTQPEANTLQFDFAPSKPDMPVVEPVQVNLPAPESGGDVDLTGYATEQYVREYAQPVGNYALKNEIPAVPVKSVNGKTGAVSLTASDVGALPSTYTPPNQTAAQVGADPKGTAAAAVGQHNTAVDSHNDIRLEMKAINDRLTAFFDSDDQTLDELSEIVAYITSNKALIDSITTSKVSVVDIINNLTTNVTNKPLSAAQGVVLKGLIDSLTASLSGYQPKGNYALASQIPTKVSQLQNDAGYLNEHQDISGKLDATALPAAINTALAQAKASGEFNGADGATGPAGPKPVKGVDYWTEADQEAIVQQVITALGTPVFGTVDMNKVITLNTDRLVDGTYTLGYEGKNGEFVELCTLKKGGPSYTNQLPISTDASGAVYNGTGYKTGYRLGSSSTESEVTGTNPTFITGFIPIANGQTVRLENCYIDTDGINGFNSAETIAYYGKAANSLYISLYNSSKGVLNAVCWSNLSSSGYFTDIKMDSEGKVTEFKINRSTIAYIRLTLAGDAPNAIITVDEPITD